MHKKHILISLEPRHAESMLTGNKSVELRRRPITVESGDVMWIYSKRPCAEVVGWVEVSAVHGAAPSSIWRKYGAKTAITRGEFFDYFTDRSVAYAIEIRSFCRLKKPVSLARLRLAEEGFHPPQFFKRLNGKGGCLNELIAATS